MKIVKTFTHAIARAVIGGLTAILTAFTIVGTITLAVAAVVLVIAMIPVMALLYMIVYPMFLVPALMLHRSPARDDGRGKEETDDQR